MGRPGPMGQYGPKGDKVMFLLFWYFSAYHRQSARLLDFIYSVLSVGAHSK